MRSPLDMRAAALAAALTFALGSSARAGHELGGGEGGVPGPDDLVMPDPGDLRDLYDPNGHQVERLDFVDLACGGDRKVERCEEMGGTVELVSGLGCFSVVRLHQLGLASKTSALHRMATRGNLARVQLHEDPVPVPAETDGETLRSLALDSGLLQISAAERDLRKWQRQNRDDPFAIRPDFGCVCTCTIFELVDGQVTNARKGDVALTPVSDGGGEDIVRTIMQALGQNHRHALMFLDEGHNVRHTTAENEIDEDDLESNTKLVKGVLENGLPGMITQTVDEALADGRLGYSGLLLTHPPTLDWLFRGVFEDAADIAEAADGYYKINDYTDLDGMNLAYAPPSDPSWENGNLRGTHCSGYVHWAYDQAGLVISESFYSQSLRENIAELLHQVIKDEISASLGFWDNLGAALISAKKKIANQVVNCFADLGCGNNSSDWKSQITSAYNVSPDNLLPDEFDLQGSGCAFWSETMQVGNLSFQLPVEICAGDHVENPNGASVTPFTWVEPLNLLGSHWDEVVLEDW